jgi:hypothetical protein
MNCEPPVQGVRGLFGEDSDGLPVIRVQCECDSVIYCACLEKHFEGRTSCNQFFWQECDRSTGTKTLRSRRKFCLGCLANHGNYQRAEKRREARRLDRRQTQRRVFTEEEQHVCVLKEASARILDLQLGLNINVGKISKAQLKTDQFFGTAADPDITTGHDSTDGQSLCTTHALVQQPFEAQTYPPQDAGSKPKPEPETIATVELGRLNISDLKKLAFALDATTQQLDCIDDSEDGKAATTELVQSLLTTLDASKVSQLKRKARSLGATEAQLDDLDDALDHKRSAVQLVLQLALSSAVKPCPNADHTITFGSLVDLSEVKSLEDTCPSSPVPFVNGHEASAFFSEEAASPAPVADKVLPAGWKLEISTRGPHAFKCLYVNTSTGLRTNEFPNTVERSGQQS